MYIPEGFIWAIAIIMILTVINQVKDNMLGTVYFLGFLIVLVMSLFARFMYYLGGT